MVNPSGCVEIALSVFSGENLDMQATDLPSGLSPGAIDCAFEPGSFYTRPPLQVFSTRGNTTQAVYHVSYKRPDSSISQLVFYSDGGMFSDGTQFAQTQAGNRFHACNIFGRTYIATSDGLHGADVPLQLSADGTVDRVSQDGPGGAPTVANYAIPAVSLVTGSTGTPIPITTATPINPVQVQVSDDPGQPSYGGGGGYQPPRYETYYTSILFQSGSAHGLTVGEAVTIAGNDLYSLGTVTVSAVDSPTQFEVVYQTQSAAVGNGGTATPVAPLLIRSNNQVTATTATANRLRVGYQVNITGVADATQGLTSIVIDNPTLPGVATITTSAPHGFVPGNQVGIANVAPAVVGGGLASYNIQAATTEVTTNTAHLLAVGDVVVVTLGPSGVAIASAVTAVPSATQFVYATVGAVSTGTTGSVYLPWVPISGTVFTVNAVPSLTTFQVSVSQGNGTWTTGNLTFPWDGTFFVTSIISPTSFTYSQSGPNNSVQSGSGLVTPSGQISPGPHKFVWIFQTRTGYLTAPGPSVTLNASGDQYLYTSDAPIGPSNVVARILAGTGANGGNYFYLPVAPQVNGQIVGTSSVINDNTTTSAIFDFSDQSLLSAVAIDIPGNNLFNQVVLGPCLGFYSYASRLFAWGERNKIQQFVNMGFEGGYSAAAPNVPLGWTLAAPGTLANGPYGQVWQFGTAGVGGAISQPAFTDRFGVAILQPNTQYTFRAKTSGTITAEFYSPTSGVLATATFTSTAFGEAVMSAKTPVSIPQDTVIRFYAAAVGTPLDEIEFYYTQNPYLLFSRASYVNNPEAFDGVTGILGPNDPQPVMGMVEDTDEVLSVLTFGPKGALYQAINSPDGEPVTWSIPQKGKKCGLISVWAIAEFESWFVWASDTGLRIYNGGTVDKMSQEEQPWWDTFNPSAKQLTVVANDPYTRRLYITACVGTATINNSMKVLDYRELNTASILASSGTLRVGYSGKVITTDLTRKWSQWSITANYCGVVSLADGSAVLTICGGRGASLQTAWTSSVYTLNEASLSGVDADYGPFWQNFAYPTYFFISEDDAQAKQLGTHRLSHLFMTMNASGVGTTYVVPALDRIDNYGRATRALILTEDLARDLEWGLNVTAERVSYLIKCQPTGVAPFAPTAQAGVRVSSLVIALKTAPYSPVRGRNNGLGSTYTPPTPSPIIPIVPGVPSTQIQLIDGVTGQLRTITVENDEVVIS